MPEFFFPTEALEYVRECTAERFDQELRIAKDYAQTASVYHVEDRIERYLGFLSQLVRPFICCSKELWLKKILGAFTYFTASHAPASFRPNYSRGRACSNQEMYPSWK
jgi:hypothetical protein